MFCFLGFSYTVAVVWFALVFVCLFVSPGVIIANVVNPAQTVWKIVIIHSGNVSLPATYKHCEKGLSSAPLLSSVKHH